MDFKMLLLLTLMAVIGSSYCENSAMKFSTKDCRLTEPVYNFTFDFNSLHSELAHVAKSNEDDTFEFNLCGNSSRTCDGQRNVAACLQRKDKEYILGRQHELNYVNGKMFFEFSNGSKCATGGGEYKLHVIVACDYTLDKVQSTVTAYSKDACSFYITFETPLACLPQPESIKNNQCSVKDSTTGHVYDLMPLSDTNYRTTDRNRSSFVLNVCKPVLYGENAMCPAGSSICFLRKNNDSTTSYINYGTVQTKPTLENGMLIMTHTSDTPCLNNKNYSTIIYFTCNKDVKSAHPEFLGYKECVNKFSFATPLACNDLPPCTVTTHNGEILDMRSLQDKPFTLSLQNDNYTIGVCSAAKGPCLDSDGACQSRDKQSTSLGKWNAHLLYNQTGTPYLIYENGAECQLNGQTKYWSTKIEFVCANGSSNTNAATKDNNSNNKAAVTDSQALGPKIIENSNCELLIHYRTPLACQEQIQCKVKVGVEHSEDGTGIEVVDLTPLISVTENYEAKIDATLQKQLGTTTKFFLNVCRPLVSKYGLGCAGGSAACMATVKGANKPENEKSLGYPQASLVPINRTSVQLGYFHGAPCPSDKNSQMSSKIEFYCDMNAGRGVPVLRSMDDCHYHFTWATNVICPAHMCSFDEQTCEVVNDDISARYNLKKASYTQQGKITYNQLTVDLCSSHHKAVTDYTQGLVNLFSTAQGACSNDNSSDTINVQMRITCAYETSSQFKMLPFTNGCSLYIEQRTPEICKFLSLDVPLPQNTSSIKTTTTFPQTTTVQPSNTHPAERTASIGSILAAILSLTFFVACVGIFAFSPERRNSLRRLLRRTSSSVRYSRVQSNEEANLLLEPNGHFTDSDDDMLL